MKYLLAITTSIMLLGLANINFAYDNGDGTHTVRTHTRRDGTVVQQHKAGNAGSGIHCHNNICS